jgi:L-amino acid N-acyltransferase YncA
MILITQATNEDINQMIEICAQNLVETNRQKFGRDDFAKKGFLLSRLTFENAKKMIDDEENYFVCVAKNGDEVLGYLIACDLEKSEINFSAEILNQICAAKKGKIFYHKQIAKKLGSKNVGEKLLLAMFDEARRRAYAQIICRIVHRPFLNQASIFFHQKFGFKQVEKMLEGENELGIYQKIFD